MVWKHIFHGVENAARHQRQKSRRHAKHRPRIRHAERLVPLNRAREYRRPPQRHQPRRAAGHIRPQRQRRQHKQDTRRPRAPGPAAQLSRLHIQRGMQPERRQHAPRQLEKVNKLVGISDAGNARQPTERAIQRKILSKRQQQRHPTQPAPQQNSATVLPLAPPPHRLHQSHHRKKQRQNTNIHRLQFEIHEALARPLPSLAPAQFAPVGAFFVADAPPRPARRDEVQTFRRRLAPLRDVSPVFFRRLPRRDLLHPRPAHRQRCPARQQRRHRHRRPRLLQKRRNIPAARHPHPLAQTQRHQQQRAKKRHVALLQKHRARRRPRHNRPRHAPGLPPPPQRENRQRQKRHQAVLADVPRISQRQIRAHPERHQPAKHTRRRPQPAVAQIQRQQPRRQRETQAMKHIHEQRRGNHPQQQKSRPDAANPRQPPERFALPRMKRRRLQHPLRPLQQPHVVIGAHQHRPRRPQRVKNHHRRHQKT